MTFTPFRPDEHQHTTRPSPQAERSMPGKRTKGEDVAPAPGHTIGTIPTDYRQVTGWGVDLDTKNRPAWPKEFKSDVKELRGNVDAWQPETVKIFVSNEQPGITPVFGTSCPPKGLSGMIKEYAYQYGEATNRRWMMLLLSNRVDMMESHFMDALKGRPDNLFAEKGWKAKVKYDDSSRKYLMIGGAILGIAVFGLMLNNMRED